MTRIRVIMLSLLAVFAFSAVAASTASAKRVWTVEGANLAVGTTKSLKLVKNSSAILKAGTEEIECKTLALNAGNTIENVMVEAKGPTGRDLVTITFTACSNKNKVCTVTVPAITTPTFLNENTAAEQATEGLKIYDLFRPEGRKELTPKEVTEKGEPASKEAEEKLTKYVTITQTGTGCVNTEVTGNGVAARISPEGESVKKKIIFPCPTAIPDETLWNGVTVGLKLKAFGVTAKECVEEVEVELTTKEKWGVK